MNSKNYIYSYRILSRAYFHLPILILFFNKLNYSISQILILILTYSVTSFIYLLIKDKFDPFKTISSQVYVSELMKIIGLSLMIFCIKYENILLAQICLSLSYSLGVGIDNTIINCEFTGMVKHNIQAKSNSYMFISLLFSGIIGGFVFSINYLYPFILSLISSVIIIFISFKFTQLSLIPTMSSDYEISNIDHHRQSNNMIINYYALTRGIILTLFISVVPILLMGHAIKPLYFVLILSTYTLSGFISSRYYNYCNLQYFYKILLSVIIVIFATISILFNHVSTIWFGLLLFGIGGGMVRPITMEKISSSKEIKTMELRYFSINIFILCIIIIKGV